MISQLNAVWMSIDSIKEKELNSTSKQSFYNYVLGSPFLDQKLAVTEEDVFNHLNDKDEFLENLDDYVFTSAGIDWGKMLPHWLVIAS